MSSASTPEFARRSLTAQLLLALAATAVFGTMLWLFLEVLLVSSLWPALESPPQQGEAVAAASLATGQPEHHALARARSVREPQNTWSCLAFVFVAGLLLQQARDGLGRWFAVTVAVAGICAMLYHASAARALRAADLIGLYWTSGVLMLMLARRLGGLDPRTAGGGGGTILWLVAGVGALALTVFRNVPVAGFKLLQVPVVTAVIALGVGSMLLVYCLRQSDPRTWRYGLGAMTAMAVGYVIQMGDHPGGPWCMPEAFIQPHAVWHILCAASLGLVMQCLESPPVSRSRPIVAPAFT